MTELTRRVELADHRLGDISPRANPPAYDRGKLTRSIVHLGVGGFHRAHLAVYVDELCRAGHTDWSIVGAGVLPGDAAMAAALSAQDHLYSLIVRGADATEVSVIGSIVDYIHATPDPAGLIADIAGPDTAVVSLTVTEGGYPVDDRTGAYVAESPNAGPASAFGALTAGLARRRAAGLGGLTVLSCDNVIGNGHVARTALLGEAHSWGDGLAEWIDAEVSFPNSMVDRITPATTDADRAWLAENLGIADRWPVVTEPFRQWVVEDNFAAARLPFGDLDVLTTSNVEPYELMKLRLLNAGHSCLAYLSAGLGIDTVDAALATDEIRAFLVEFLATESTPVLPPIVGIDIAAYNESLITRFSNPAIGDQISRLCLDGSAKFPKFLLPTVRAQLDAGGPVGLSALALAGWCEYLNGDPATLATDPLLDRARHHAQQARSEPRRFLEFTEVFGADLPRSDRFVEAFDSAVRAIRDRGIPSALRAALAEVGGSSDRSGD